MYICCVLDGNIHIFTATQRDGPYKKRIFLFLNFEQQWSRLLLCVAKFFCSFWLRYSTKRKEIRSECICLCVAICRFVNNSELREPSHETTICCRLQLKCEGTRWRREGKWRGNWRMEWIASTTSEHGVSSITTADANTSAASNRLNWRPRRFKWTRPSCRKTISGFCACTITFQLASTTLFFVFIHYMFQP